MVKYIDPTLAKASSFSRSSCCAGVSMENRASLLSIAWRETMESDEQVETERVNECVGSMKTHLKYVRKVSTSASHFYFCLKLFKSLLQRRHLLLSQIAFKFIEVVKFIKQRPFLSLTNHELTGKHKLD